MAKKIDFNEIVDIESLESLKAVLATLETQLKSIVELSSKTVSNGAKTSTSKEIKETTEAVNQAKKAQDELTEVQKNQIEVNMKLQDLKKAERDRLKAEASAYDKLSQELNANRKAYKDLAAQEKDTTKEAKELLKTIQAQDKQLKQIDATVGQHQRNVGNYGNAIKGIGIKMIGWASAIGIATGAMEFFTKIMDSSQAVGDKFEAMLGGVNSSVGYLATSIANMDFSNLISGMGDAYKEGKRYAEALDLIGDKQRALGLTKANIEMQISEQKSIARNRMLDLKDREVALNKIIELEKTKLDESKKLANEEAKNELIRASNLTKRNQFNIRLTEGELQIILASQNIQDKILQGEQLRDELLNKSYITTRQVVGGDVVTDTQFSLDKFNEQLKELAPMQQAYVRYAIGMNTVDEESRKIIVEKLTQQKNVQKEYFEGIGSLNKLRTQLYNELIKNDKEEKKSKTEVKGAYELLTIAISDLEKKQKNLLVSGEDLTKEDKKRLESLKTQKDIIDAKLKLVGIYEDEVKRLTKVASEYIPQEKKLIETNSELLKQNKEYNEKIIKDAEKSKEAYDKFVKERSERIEKGLTLIDTIEQKYYDKRQERLDKEIEASRNKQDLLRQLAAKGSEDAKNNLAFEEQQQIKLEALKQKAERKKAQFELAMSVIKAYNTNLSNPDVKNPLQKTITDTVVLQAFIKSLPSFKDGVWKTKKGDLDNDGGHLAVLHKNEAVLTEDEMSPVRKAGINSAPELVNLALIAKKGLDKASLKVSKNDELTNKLDTLIQVTREKPVYLGSEFDKDNGTLVERVQYGTQLVTNHRQASKLNG